MSDVTDKPMSETQLSELLNNDEEKISQYAEILVQLNTVDNRLNDVCQRWEGSVPDLKKEPATEPSPPEATLTSIRSRFDKSAALHEKTIGALNNRIGEIRNKLEVLERIL